MPRNNQTTPRVEREAAIVDQAVELFKANGYRGTSIAAVGKAVGVASGAVLWYFPTKDDLFAAALRRIFDDARESIDSDRDAAGDPFDELAASLERLAPYRHLHREAYQRMEDSEAVRQVYEEGQLWLDERLLAVIERHAPAGADTELIAEAARFFFEGILISVRRVDRPMTEYIDMITNAVIGVATARPVGHPRD